MSRTAALGRLLAAAVVIGGVVVGGVVGARIHQKPAHPSPAQTAATAKPKPDGAPAPFDLAIGGEFDLRNTDGARRRLSDYAGRYPLIFFGYSSCKSICSVALSRMAEALDLLGADGAALAPMMITVDPERDTPRVMHAALARINPRLEGLTGSDKALADARRAFSVKAEKLFEDPDGGAIYSHGGFIYLMGPDGKLLTLMPPILSAARMAQIIRGYLPPG